MPCYHPLPGFRSQFVNPSGKRSIVFNAAEGHTDRKVEVPCGQCIGCRLERSRRWAVRIMHEAQLHQDNTFITLTYNDEELNKNKNKTLIKKDHQNFIKKLRSDYRNKKIRYFHCGEYGDKHKRPHYHSIIFGLEFEDKKLWKTVNGNKLYTSEKLEKLWGKGFTIIGAVTFESAAYVARYITKKVTGDLADEHYGFVDKTTGEVVQLREPEYVTMSRRPGIGRDWYDKFKSDCYPKDFITIRGVKQSVPRYYDSILEKEDKKQLDKVKAKRQVLKSKHKEDNSGVRLRDRGIVKKLQIVALKRSYDSET